MYAQLLEYYRQCFALVDVFHYNSKHTGFVFNSLLPDSHGMAIPITHNGIKDRRTLKTFNTERLKLGFVGSTASYKGFPLLTQVLKDINPDKWELSVWGGKIDKDNDWPIFYRGYFNAETQYKAYTEMDLLIVPSLWNETFSLVALEALSYGTPVLVSDHVGIQDVVFRYAPQFVYSTTRELQNLLTTLLSDRSPLIKYQQQIMLQPWLYDMRQHATRIVNDIYLH